MLRFARGCEGSKKPVQFSKTVGWPGQALLHPLGEGLDLVPGQLSRGGHLQAVVADRLKDQAKVGPIERHRRSLVATPEQGLAGVQAELSPDFRLSSMTLEAAGLQDRLDPGPKEGDSDRIWAGLRWFGCLEVRAPTQGERNRQHK